MITLTEKEIAEITARKQHKAQAAVLKALGIRHKIRPDGSVLVFRAAVDSGRTDIIATREPQVRLRNGPSAQIK